MAFRSNSNDDDYVIIRDHIGEFAFAKFSSCSRCKQRLRKEKFEINA